MRWHWYQPQDALPDWGRVFYYDSEFIWRHRAKPQLALMQWSTAGEDITLCDPLATPPPWKALFARVAPWVMHSAWQDVEMLYLFGGDLPQSLRDTQLGFAFCGQGMTEGLSNLAAYYLGELPDKSETCSDWLARPLSLAQTHYAAQDVALLKRLYPYLVAELQSLGRLSWWVEDCAAKLEHIRYYLTRPLLWHQIPGAQSQTPAIQQRLAALCALIPRAYRGPQIPPKVLLALARQAQTVEEVAEYLPAEHPIFARLDALQTALENPPPLPPKPSSGMRPFTAAELKMLRRLQRVRDQLALEIALPANLLASRKMLQKALLFPETSQLLQGWRRAFFGAVLER